MAKWQLIETARRPESGDVHDAPRVLLFGDCGIQMGHVYVYSDNDKLARAEGYHGDWNITHWMPLPEPPK